MEIKRDITTIQAMAVVISSIIGVGVLRLPKMAAVAGHSGAPLLTVLAVGLAYFGLLLITLLGMRFPNSTMIQYSEQIIGKWLSGLFTLLIIAFFFSLTSLAAEEFGTVVITSVLLNTPLEVTVVVMLLLAAIAAQHDIRTFTYIHLFYTPMILAPGLLIVFLSLRNANLLYILPITGNAHNQVFTGILMIAALFQCSFVYTMVIPRMRRPRRAMLAGVWSFVIAGGFYVLIVTATVSVFGPNETQKLIWPTLELAKTTALPANVLERLDVAFLAVWVTAVFTTLLTSYYLTIQFLAQLLKLQNHRKLTYVLLPLIFTMTLLIKNVIQLYDVIKIVSQLGLCVTVGYPLILLIIAIARKLRGDGENGQNQYKQAT